MVRVSEPIFMRTSSHLLYSIYCYDKVLSAVVDEKIRLDHRGGT